MPKSESNENPGCFGVFFYVVLALIGFGIIGALLTSNSSNNESDPPALYLEDPEKKEFHRNANAWAYLKLRSLQSQDYCIFRQEECADLERCARFVPEKNGYRVLDYNACRKAYRKWSDN